MHSSRMCSAHSLTASHIIWGDMHGGGACLVGGMHGGGMDLGGACMVGACLAGGHV